MNIFYGEGEHCQTTRSRNSLPEPYCLSQPETKTIPGSLAGFLGFHHFTALIVTAVWANTMRQSSLFVTVRAFRSWCSGQTIVSAAPRSSCFRVPPF